MFITQRGCMSCFCKLRAKKVSELGSLILKVFGDLMHHLSRSYHKGWQQEIETRFFPSEHVGDTISQWVFRVRDYHK